MSNMQKVSAFILFIVAVTAGAADGADIRDPRGVSLKNGSLLVSIAEDPSFTMSKMQYEVKANGKKFNLKFLGAPPEGLFTGQKVHLLGAKKLSAKSILVTSRTFQVAGGDLPPAVGGVHQSVVLIIKSATSVTSATPSSIASALQATDTWYVESSYQMLAMKNDREGDGIADIYTVTIPDSTAGAPEGMAFTYCNTAKSNASAQAGITPSLWNHVICILPPDMNYSWFGQAYINGSDIVISGKYAGGYPGGYTHEIGHNLGLHHSNTPPNAEYGESACVMGGNAGTARRDFNGPHKYQMGWFGVTTAGEGTYTLSAVEAQPSQRASSNMLLKIRDTIASQDLYISYRAPIGTFGPGLNIANRTSIHTWGGGAVQTYLQGSIGDGETFSRNGVVITQISHTETSAMIQIGANCTTAAAAVSLSPASQAATFPATKQYVITVTNKDVNCSTPVTYSLNASLPSPNWSGTFSSSSLNVAPGQSASAALDITPPVDATTAAYSFSISAAAAGHTNASATGTYILDNASPNAVTDLTATIGRKGKLTLSWSVPSEIGSGIASYDIFRNGAVIASVSTNQYSESPGAGTFTYQVQTRDRAGNVSPLSNAAQVTTTNGPGRKK